MTKPSILVVDDAADIVHLLKMVLEVSGFRVLTAMDGAAALDRFFNEQPDLVLLDLNLPIMTGWDVLAQIKACSSVPVFVMSGNAAVEEDLRHSTPDADSWFVKPFDVLQIVGRIRSALQLAAPLAVARG